MGLERLEARRLLAGDMQLRFEFTDPAANPVESVSVGDLVRLRAYVQDIRETPQGVSSAYVDLVWDNPRVLTTGADIVHGPDYDVETSGDATMFPRIEDVGGGFDGLAPEMGEEGDEFLLFTVPLVANSVGTFRFRPEMADGFGRDILLVGSNDPVPFDPENVTVVGDLSLEVLPTVAFEQAVSDVNEADSMHTVNVVLDTGGAELADDVTLEVVVLPTSEATAADIELVTTTVTFTAGSTGGSEPVLLNVLPDDVGQGNLQLDLGLRLPADSAAGLGHLDRHQVTLVDDDLDRVEIEVRLYADQNGEPGVVLTEGVVNSGESFFVEILIGDYRDDPPAPGEQRGVIALRIDEFAWPTANVVSLNEFPIDNPLNPADPNPLVTAEFPLSRMASLVNLGGGAQAIQNLVGFSNPTGGQGTAIGINRPQRFSLMQFVANTPTATAVQLEMEVDTDTITLADNSDPANTSVEQLDIVVNSLPIAVNDIAGVNAGSANNMLNVLANDSDAQDETLEITSVSVPTAGGTVSIVGTPGTPGHQLLYTPPADFRGTDTFVYTITDGNQLSEATALVTVDVDPLRIEKATNAADPANPTAAEDADEIPGRFVAVGTDVTWTYQVFNEGSRPLDITEVVDDFGTPLDTIDDFNPAPVESDGFNVGDLNEDGLLDPGEVWQFTSEGVETYSVVAGQYTNVARVTAEAPDNDDELSDGDPSNHFGVEAQVSLLKQTNGQDADAAPGVFLPVGQIASLTYQVGNPGNVPLELVQIVDDNGTPGDDGDDLIPAPVPATGPNQGDANENGLIDPGETWLFAAERDPVTAGQHTNVATVTVNAVDFEGNDLDGFDNLEQTDASNHFGVALAEGDLQFVKETNGSPADEPPGTFLPVGTTATFDYSLTLGGSANVPVIVTGITDDNGTPEDETDDFTPSPVETGGFNDGDTNQNNLLDPGETWLFTAEREVTAGQYTNSAEITVAAADFEGETLPDIAPLMTTAASNHFGAEAQVVLEKSTNGQDADLPPGALLPIGSTATFRYEVSNPGTVPLGLVQLLDDNGTPEDVGDDFEPPAVEEAGNNVGDTNQNGRIDPGETWIFEAERTVTGGQYTNEAVVLANPLDFEGADLPDFEDVSDVDASNHFGNPIRIEKATNAADPANPTPEEDADTAPGRFLVPGTSVVWTYLVSNAGDNPLSIVEIVDDFGTENTDDDFSPVAVEGTTAGVNIGDLDQDGLVDPGEVWQFTSAGVVTFMAPAGQYSNQVTILADVPATGGTAEGADASNLFGAVAEVTLEKETNGQDADSAPGPFLPVGEAATFTYSVGNPGNVPLEIVEFLDDNGTPDNDTDDFTPTPVDEDSNGSNDGDLNANGLVDPGEVWLYEAVRTVTPGQFTNTAVISANPVDFEGDDLPDLADVEASDPSNHFGAAATSGDLQLQKLTNGQDADAPTGPLLAVGETAVFTYEVTLLDTATVPVDLTGIVDDNGTPEDDGDDFSPDPVEVNLTNVGDTNGNGLLDPGETWLFESGRTVTAGQYANGAMVMANPVTPGGEDIEGLDELVAMDGSHHFGVDAAVAVEKATNGNDADDPPGPTVPVGGTATFSYEVSNPGNVSLQLVELTDDNGTPADDSDDFTPEAVEGTTPGFNVGDENQNNLIDTGETWRFSATRTVTAGQYTNIVLVTANPVDAQGNDLPEIGEVTDSDRSNHLGSPLRLEKATNAADPANPTSQEDADQAPGVYLPVGTEVVWTYLVINEGDEPLEITEIVDDFGTPADDSDDFNPLPVESGGFNIGDVNQDRLLDFGEAWQFTSAGAVSYQAVAGQYANLARATATDPATSAVSSATDPSHHFGAAIESADIDLQKATNGEDADDPPGPTIESGTPVTFTYELSLSQNANVPAAITSLIDDNGTPADDSDDFTPDDIDTDEDGFNDGDVNENGLLDPGETWLFEFVRDNVTPGQYTNVAEAMLAAVDPEGSAIPGLDDLSASDTSNHFGLATSVTLTKRTNGQDADDAPGPVIPVGGSATFTYEVANTGNVTLELLTLIDDNGTPADNSDDFAPSPVETGGFNDGDTNQNGLIDEGEVWLFEALRDPVTAGQFTNTATVTTNPVDEQGADLPGRDNAVDSDASNHFGAVADAVTLQKLTNGEDADMPPGAAIPTGGSATFTYEVSLPETVNVPVEILALIDDAGTPDDEFDDFTPAEVDENNNGFNDGDTNENGLLDPGETWLYEATRDPVTTGQYTNTATVTVNPVDFEGNDLPGLDELTGTDQSNHIGAVADEIFVEKATDGEDADTSPGPFLPVGATATFTYEVTSGPNVNVGLQIVEISDDNGTPDDTSDDFTPDDVDTDNDGFNDGDLNENGALDPGETWLFEATRTVTAGQFTNLVLVRGNPVDSNGNDIDGLDELTDTDPSNHFGVQAEEFLVVKQTNGEDAETAPGPVLAVGETAAFTYEASLPQGTNVSVEITGVTDDNGTPDDDTDDFVPEDVDEDNDGFNDGDVNENGLLDVGETWLYEATRTVTAGQYTNTVQVTGTAVDPQGNAIEGIPAVTGTDTSNHFGAQLDAVSVEKATNGEDADTPTGPELVQGTTATFTYEVSVPSPGNVPVRILDLIDDNGTPDDDSDDFTPDAVDEDNDGFNDGDANENNLVDPGETWLFEATRTVTVGQYANLATLTVEATDFNGDPIEGLDQPITDTDPSHHLGIEGPSSISGSVYIDVNGNGERDSEEAGIPGVRIVLLDDDGMEVGETRTDDDGNYRFEDLLTGTYQLAQSQPIAFIDGATTAGTFGGMEEVNQIVEIDVPPNADGEGYLFGEAGIAPEYISKRMFLASTPPFVEVLRELVAKGEEEIPDFDGGTGGAEGEAAPLRLRGFDRGEGESAAGSDEILSETAVPLSFPWDAEGERGGLFADLTAYGVSTGRISEGTIPAQTSALRTGEVPPPAALSRMDSAHPSASGRDEDFPGVPAGEAPKEEDFATAVDEVLGDLQDWLP